MRPEDTVRLQHLTEAATKAIGYSTDRTRADLPQLLAALPDIDDAAPDLV